MLAIKTIHKPCRAVLNARIAIVHDAIADNAGGEEVLRVLMRILPNAHIFTASPHAPTTIYNILGTHKRVIKLHRFYVARFFRRIIQLSAPLIWPNEKLSDYDIVISHGGYYLAHLVHAGNILKSQLRIHYAIEPPVNLYNSQQQRWFEKIISLFYYSFIKKLDKQALKNIDELWTVSKFINKSMSALYSRRGQVIYPPTPTMEHTRVTAEKRDTYCYAGRLENRKNIQLIIDAFNQNGLPLVIAGDGKSVQEYKRRAKPNICFSGYLDKYRLHKLFIRSIAFIHAAENDPFPLAPIEAMSLGVPVVGYYSGGLRESVINKITGVFFYSLTTNSVNSAIQRLTRLRINRKTCQAQAGRFSQQKFIYQITHRINKLYQKKNNT